MTFFLCALLLCNVFMVGLLFVKPTQNAREAKDESSPENGAEENQQEDNDIVKIVKVAVEHAVPEVLKVLGQFSDANPADIEEPEEEHPSVVPDDQLEEVFKHSTVTASDLGDEEPEVQEPKAEGLDFKAMQTTVNVLQGKSTSAEDMEVAKRTLPDISGTEIIERISLDPIVRKRILMIECQLPVMVFEPEIDENAEEKPKRKIVFHADIDTTGVDGIDFNIYT